MTRRDDDEARAVPVTLRNKEDEEVSSLDTSNETADGDYRTMFPLKKAVPFLFSVRSTVWSGRRAGFFRDTTGRRLP